MTENTKSSSTPTLVEIEYMCDELDAALERSHTWTLADTRPLRSACRTLISHRDELLTRIEELETVVAELKAAAMEREADIVARLRKQMHEAEPHDVRIFAGTSTPEIAESLRNAVAWLPTAYHALLHAAAARLDDDDWKDAERWRFFADAAEPRISGNGDNAFVQYVGPDAVADCHHNEEDGTVWEPGTPYEWIDQLMCENRKARAHAQEGR